MYQTCWHCDVILCNSYIKDFQVACDCCDRMYSLVSVVFVGTSVGVRKALIHNVLPVALWELEESPLHALLQRI
jgi:hypothetical protein